MLSDLEGFGFVFGAFIALLGGLGILRRCWSCNPEVLRKSLHVGMGLLALSLPWLFASIWPVVLLTGAVIGLLIAIRLLPALREKMGGVIHGVERYSWGEVYFALGVAGLYAFSHDEPLYYCLSVLIFVCADTAASLIGSRYGRFQYEILGEKKSIEGSLAFLLAAFLVTALGLEVFSLLGSFDGLVAALALSLPITLVEAEAGKGSDNVLLPLITFVLLKVLLPLDEPELVVFLCVAALAVPIAFVFLCSPSDTDSSSEDATSLGNEFPGLGNWI